VIFTPTDIAGVWAIQPEPVRDERGFFARWYCAVEFAERGLELPAAQGGVSRNARQGTLRGLHFIPAPNGEVKLVRCIAGKVFDVVVDLRPESATCGKWIAEILSAESHCALYIPHGCAHGFLTLEDNSDVSYRFSEPYRAGLEQGVRWNDPDLAIRWPSEPQILSQRDLGLPLLRELKFSAEG